MIEVFKILNGYAPSVMDNFFIFRKNTHNLINLQIISSENRKTVRYGSKKVSYRTPLVCENLREEYKLANSLSKFNSKIKAWKCYTCVCWFCRPFLQNLVFI